MLVVVEETWSLVRVAVTVRWVVPPSPKLGEDPEDRLPEEAPDFTKYI